jgi:hypothetical protein
MTMADAQRRRELIRYPAGAAMAMLVNTVHVWAAYREAETIFEIESMPAECPRVVTVARGTPTAALRLPSLCPC